MEHSYSSRIEWTGNSGEGTRTYRGYDRAWIIAVPGKPVIHCSNDPLLGGDPSLSNPEDLLLATVSACHMLWYLHYACEAGIIVHAYADEPVGLGEVTEHGAGRFIGVTLRPHIVVDAGTDLGIADAIHEKIHTVCFVARSVNFPIRYAASYAEAAAAA